MIQPTTRSHSGKHTAAPVSERFLITLILVLLPVALFWNLGLTPVRFEEPRRAVVALEMMVSGNYIMPTIHGDPYYNKPPLYNWVLTGLFHLFGYPANWVLRLPTVLSLLLMGLCNYLFVKKYLSLSVAVVSSLFLVTSADILFSFSMVGEIDLFYSLIVYLQIISIFYFFGRKQYLLLFLVSYLLTAAGFLTKGFPSPLFQAFTLLAFLIVEKKWKLLFGWQHILGICLFFGLCIGYFGLYGQYNDPYSYVYRMFTESTVRAEAARGIYDRIGHLLFFPVMMLKILSPWSLLLLFMFRQGVVRQIWEHPFLRFCMLFVLANIGVYWLSPGTRERYLYMFIPFLLPVITWFFLKYRQENGLAQKLITWIFGVLLVVTLLIFPLLPFIPYTSKLPYIGLIAVGGTLLALPVVYGYFKQVHLRIYYIVLATVLLRLGFDAIMIPARYINENEAHYEKAALRMIQLAGGKPIYFTGIVEDEKKILTLPILGEIPIFYQGVPYVTFQIPFHITRETGNIMRTDYSRNPNAFYLSDQWSAEGLPVKVWYRFYSREVQGDYVFYTYR